MTDVTYGVDVGNIIGVGETAEEVTMRIFGLLSTIIEDWPVILALKKYPGSVKGISGLCSAIHFEYAKLPEIIAAWGWILAGTLPAIPSFLRTWKSAVLPSQSPSVVIWRMILVPVTTGERVPHLAI